MGSQHLLLLREEDVERTVSLIPPADQYKFRAYYFSLKIEQSLNDTNFEKVGILGADTAAPWRTDLELSDQIARSFDFELAILRETAFGITHGVGWHYTNLNFIINCLLRLKRASNELRKAIPLRGDVIVPWCVSPADYYFDSELFRSTSIDALRAGDNRLIKLKFSKSKLFNRQAYDYVPDFSGLSCQHLVHLPTASYAYLDHVARIKKIRHVIDIQSPYFDVPIIEKRARLTRPVRNVLGYEHATAIAKLTEKILEGIVERSSLPSLVDRILQRENFQVNTLLTLRSTASLKEVKTLDIADHDAGIQGPLVTFASEREIEVFVWPHSTVCAQPFPSTSKTTKNFCVTEENYFSKLGSSDASVKKLFFPQMKKTLRKNKRILLLHNEFEDVAGVTKIDVSEFRLHYQKLKRKLRHSGVSYRVRHKPKHSYIHGLDDAEEPLATGDLSEWFSWAGVCVSFGEISTALIKLTQADCYCVHLSFGAISPLEYSSCPPGVRLFEIKSYRDSFIELERWIDHELLKE